MDSKEESAPMEDAIPNTRLVLALKQLALERIKSEIEMHKKLFEIELQFQDKFKQFDDKRRMIVSGDYIPTEEECKYEYADPNAPIVETQDRGIPHFWATIFANLDMLNDMVQERDRPLIDLLTDIRCVLLAEPSGYRLEFEFAENDHFTNKVLTKEYYFADGYDPSDPLNYDTPYLSRVKGCRIDWKSPSKDLTQKKVAKKMKHRNSNQVKTVEKMTKCDSFFNFFDPPDVTMEDADEDTKELLASDVDIGELLRINVIPRAIIYYTGEGIDEDDYSDMDEMDEFDEEFEDDFDEDEDDEDEDEDENDDGDDGVKPKSKSKAKGALANGHSKKNRKNDSTKDVPPECNPQ